MKASFQRFCQKVIGEGGVRALASLFVLLLARNLGPESFGRYSSALALAAICIVIVDLGTNAILTREMARTLSDRHMIANSSHLLKLLASGCAWTVLLVLTFILHMSPQQRFITVCLGIVVIGQTLTDYFSSLLSGMEEMGWEAVLKVVCRGLGLATGFIGLLLNKPLESIVALMAAGTVGGYFAAVLIVRHRIPAFGLLLHAGQIKAILRSSLPLFGSAIFFILYDVQDVLLLNAFRFPHYDVGIFSAAMKIIDVLRVYPVLLVGVFVPTLSRLHLTDLQAFWQKQRRITAFMIFSMATMCVGIYLGSPILIHALYAGRYDAATPILRLLLPALFGLAINHAQLQVLIALNQEHKLFLAALLTCVVNVVSGAFLLSYFGIPGVCYALLLSEIFFFLYLDHLTNAFLKR